MVSILKEETMRTTDVNGSLNLGGMAGPLRDSGNTEASSRPEEPRSLRLVIRIRPAQGRDASDFRTLLTELEDRCLAQERSTGSDGHIRTVIVSLWSNKRHILETTLSKHGYEIKDEFEM